MLCGVLAIGVMLPAASQSAELRQRTETFRDSLAGVRDTVALKALERTLIADARERRSDATAHLRLGFLSLRLGELGGRSHYEDAGSEFQWVIDLEPQWPYGWFGLALAELGVGDSDMPLVQGLRTMLGKDALTRSANAFARSAEVDPQFVQGLTELGRTALQQRINSRIDVALAALRRAASTPAGRNPQVLLIRGQVEREAGSLDSARVALETVLRDAPRNARALLELARVRFAQGREDGVQPWFRGLGVADAEATGLYRADLATIMPDSTLRRFDVASLVDRVAIAQRFWAARDADELHRPGQRLREHYRRLDYARRNYRLVTPNRQFDIAERYRSGQTEFDDRGIIYIRHGSPDQRAAFNVPGIEPNETWRYRRDDGDLIFHFVARQDVQDFRVVESVFDILGFAATVALRDGADTLLQSDRVSSLLRSREGLNPIYSRLLAAGRGGSAQLLTAERTIGRQSIADGTSNDSWGLRFSGVLPARVETIAVGQDADGPALQFAFAVPGSALHGAANADGYVYPVRMRATVMSSDGRTVLAVDTTRAFVSAGEIPSREHLLGRVTARVPAGDYTVRVAIETNDAGMVTPRRSIHVAGDEVGDIGLSDLAIGSRMVNLPWLTESGDTAWSNPLATFPQALPMELYFEVSGVARGESYRIDISMARPRGGSIFRKVFGGNGAAIRLGFEGVHPGGIAAISRVVDLSAIKPGTYVLDVRVTAPDGRTATRRRELTVTP